MSATLAPVFLDRHLPSEDLYFRLGGFGCHDIAVALTDGGVEMAFPTVDLQGGTLRMLRVEQLDLDRVPGFAGEHVWLFDDGELGDRALCRAARLLKRSGAATVGVAAAVTSRRLRHMAGRNVIDALTVLWPREKVSPGQPLFGEPPRLAGYWLRTLEIGRRVEERLCG